MKNSLDLLQHCPGGASPSEVLCVLALTCALVQPLHATTVAVLNSSKLTFCAEEDNVSVGLLHPMITNFTIEARPPVYPVMVDSTAPNFENCSFGTNDPVYAFPNPRRMTLFDNGVTVVLAERFASFWRSNVVTVRVGGNIVTGMHTVTLHRKIPQVSSWPQCLVLYGADGNIRLKPHPPTTLPDNVFGASVLVGPVTNEIRPVVNIAAVEYVPGRDDLILTYAQGGTATLHIQEISRNKLSLDVTLNTALVHGQPFTMVRSMFVNSTNCDTELGAIRLTNTDTWEPQPILGSSNTRAGEVLFSRTNEPQAHNRSAPDIWFGNFAARSMAVMFTNAIVATRAGHLVALPIGTIPGQEVVLTDSAHIRTVATNCQNPTVQQDSVYFDATSGHENWSHVRLFRYNLVLGWLLKLSSDPFGNSHDWRPVVSPGHDRILLTSNRTGVPRLTYWGSQLIGPGFGTLFGSDTVSVWTRGGLNLFLAYIARPNQILTVDCASGQPQAIATNAWIESVRGRIERLDSSPAGDSLLVSTSQGIFLYNLLTAELTLLRNSGREAAFHPHDRTRLLFSEVPSGESDWEVFTACLTPTENLTNIERLTFNDLDERQPCWFALRDPSLRVETDGYWFKVLAPRWTIANYELQYSDNLSLPIWQVSSETKSERTYHYEVWLPPQRYGPVAFFRLRLK